MSNIYNFIEMKQQVYITPKFLDSFDFSTATCREYLRSRVRFKSMNLGFIAKMTKTSSKGLNQHIHFKCFVGSAGWNEAKKKLADQMEKAGKKMSPSYDVGMCPFYLEYSREIDIHG